MFKRLLKITIVAVFFLIFIGSVVRSTGSGMGCPDWPTCFGKVIPPTSADELPKDYLKKYKDSRVKKNQKLEKIFVLLGLEDVLHDRQDNHATYQEIHYDFNKAWTEYINRIVGVVIGFLVLACFIFSFKYNLGDKSIVLLASLSLLILLFEALLGSYVVSTGLFPDLISVHMILALVLLFLLLLIYIKINPPLKSDLPIPKVVIRVSVLAFVLSFIQIIIGIDVRETVDYLHNQKGIYNGIIELLPNSFYIHRSYSIVVLIVNVWLLFITGRFGVNNLYTRLILPLLIAEIFVGVTLAYFDLPRISQPIHLLLASLLVGMQFLNILYVKFATPK